MQLFKRKPEPGQMNQEASGNFDLGDLPDLFAQVAPLIPSGFGPAEIGSLVGMADAMAVDDEKEVIFPIEYVGHGAAFTVGIFMDDIDAPDVRFSAPPALAQAITDLIERFNEERGR